MAFQPQRFVHAANIRLDVPVSVQTSDLMTDELRLAFEDATLHSFEAVIDACLDHQVDYLLLSGNVFIEADRSLRARLALLNGMRRLDLQQISVFVIPGDADPPEAWRSIPELPGNVRVCYSSDPEPVELLRNDQVVATVSASTWYGEKDAFGIRVIAENQDGIDPFRLGVISVAKYQETQRMAAMAAESSADLLSATLQNSARDESPEVALSSVHGRLVPLSEPPQPVQSVRSPVRISSSDESLAKEQSSDQLEGNHFEDERLDENDHPDENDHRDGMKGDMKCMHESRAWDANFIAFTDETFREGRLNYLALTGELDRILLQRPLGRVHCPGTTQPRSHQESAMGSCSLVEVTADGQTTITLLDTSSIDWKDIEISVPSQATLSWMLQLMKSRLLQQPIGAADRIWSVHWTVRCSIPVLQELVHEDLAVAVAVELDQLEHTGRTVTLLHNVQLIPNSWQVDDPGHLGRRYADIVNDPQQLESDYLAHLLQDDGDLSAGWRQRLGALIVGLNREQILARMRIDGAGWFIPDFSVVQPDDSVVTDSDHEDSPDDELMDTDGIVEEQLSADEPVRTTEGTESIYAREFDGFDQQPETDEEKSEGHSA